MSDSPETTTMILDLARKGSRPPEISKALRIPVDKVYRVLHDARKSGKTVPNFREDQAEGLMTDKVRALFAPHADRRDITVNILARRILAKVAEDGLVEAVLDDGVPG